MKNKIAVLGLIAVATGVFAWTRPHNAPSTDLRDAVADSKGGAFGELKGYGSSGADVPAPVTAERVAGTRELSLAAPGSLHNGKRIVRQRFAVGLSLDPSMFRGDTAAKTRASVERALAGKGLKLLQYRDDYAVSYLEFSAAREEGMLGFTSNRRDIESRLMALPEVKSLKEKEWTKQDLYWTVYLKEGLYPPRIERIFSSLNMPHRITHNNVRDDLTVELEAGSADPAAAVHVLKTLPGIKMENHGGLKVANMLIVTYYSDGSDTELLGWAGCVSGNCKVFDSAR